MTPDQHTIKEFYLDVGDGHELYVQDWGNKAAKKPILFLHGGPGSGCKDGHKELFDPTKQRVIFHDQRASGNSKTTDPLRANTTEDLAKDITRIADKLKIDSFILVGGSWGSCLALYYALQSPQRVTALLLRGVTTCAAEEIAWLDQGGFRALFPEVWQKYLDATPIEHHKDPSAYHYQMALNGPAAKAKQSGYAYSCMEAALLRLDDRFTPPDYELFEPEKILIEMHYMSNGCFLPDNYILDRAQTLTMPIWIVQGRYDVICPPFGAYNLAQRTPHANLIWTIAGHSNGDRANYDLMRSIALTLTEA